MTQSQIRKDSVQQMRTAAVAPARAAVSWWLYFTRKKLHWPEGCDMSLRDSGLKQHDFRIFRKQQNPTIPRHTRTDRSCKGYLVDGFLDDPRQRFIVPATNS